jgi:DNA-directed RNA polymerase specialized sigma subunit
MAKRKKKKHYIDNKKFEETIFNYLENKEEHEEELMKQLDLLITSILISFKFKVEFDDAKQECFVLCLKVLKNFTREKGSAFNYFTTVIVNNLKLIYTKNKKYQEKIAEYRDKKIKAFLDETPDAHQ